MLAAERAGGDQKVAETWLQAFLGNGGRPSNEIKSQATECGISLATLRRAKEAIGARAQLVHNEGGKAHWIWTLADEAAQDAASPTMPDGNTQFARICAAG